MTEKQLTVFVTFLQEEYFSDESSEGTRLRSARHSPRTPGSLRHPQLVFELL